MPDNGQYFIAVLLSLVNIICFRRVIIKQTIKSPDKPGLYFC